MRGKIMKIDKAREIAAEHGVEEGAKYEVHKMGSGEVIAEVTITDVTRTGPGIRTLEWTVERGEKCIERWGDVADVAGKLDAGYWSEIKD